MNWISIVTIILGIINMALAYFLIPLSNNLKRITEIVTTLTTQVNRLIQDVNVLEEEHKENTKAIYKIANKTGTEID